MERRTKRIANIFEELGIENSNAKLKVKRNELDRLCRINSIPLNIMIKIAADNIRIKDQVI